MEPLRIYIIDTSSLVTLQQWRPPPRNTNVWQNLGKLVRDDRLIAPEEVYEEICAGQDSLKTWAVGHHRKKMLFRKTTRQHAGIAKEIVHHFPDFVERDRPTPQADPFVVALAVHESRQLLAQQADHHIIVITEEKYTPTGRPRIPHVCAHYQVRYLSIHQLFVHEGWTL